MEVTEVAEGAYVYTGESGSFYVNMDFYDGTTKTTMDKVDDEMVDVEYNLLISPGINPNLE